MVIPEKKWAIYEKTLSFLKIPQIKTGYRSYFQLEEDIIHLTVNLRPVSRSISG